MRLSESRLIHVETTSLVTDRLFPGLMVEGRNCLSLKTLDGVSPDSMAQLEILNIGESELCWIFWMFSLTV